MPGLNKDRKRPITIGFRVSPEEKNKIDARVKASGLPYAKYFYQTFTQQKIVIAVGKYESDRLALELKKLREAFIRGVEEGNGEEQEVVQKAIALLEELIKMNIDN